MNTSPDMPSSRPMTLRQQLLHDMRMLSEEYFGNETYGKYLSFNHKLQELFDRYGQEIAREARLDEVTGFGGDTEHPTFCYLRGKQFRKCIQCLKDERLAELTQKPPQPPQDDLEEPS